MQRLRRGIYLLEAAEFSNCYLIEGPHGLILFDTGRPRAVPLLIEEISRNAFALKDVEAVVLSHAHFDHAGGGSALLDRHRVKVFAHPSDIPAVKGKADRSRGLRARLRRLMSGSENSYRPLEVVLPIAEGETLRPLPQWQVLHLPGHTAGSIALFQPGERVLLCGDALSNSDDRLCLSADWQCDDPVQARESVRKLAALDVEVLGCGHGPVVLKGAGLKIHELVQPLS